MNTAATLSQRQSTPATTFKRVLGKQLVPGDSIAGLGVGGGQSPI